MTSALLKRLHRKDEGFTLIELMVVVLIIAILIAIAIPTFLGAKNSADARAAQSNLRNTLTSEQSFFSDAQQYASSNVKEFVSTEPSLHFQGASGDGLASKNDVVVELADNPSAVPSNYTAVSGSLATTDFGQTMCAFSEAANNTWYGIAEGSATGGALSPGTYYWKGTTLTGAGCNATTFPATATDTGAAGW